MSNILAAELRYYNANDRNKNTGDCVVRSLSIAYGMRYETVHKDLLELAGVGDSYKYVSVYSRFIQLHGFVSYHQLSADDRVTVDEFADTHSQGTYLVVTGKKPTTYHDHIICLENGKIWDTWDSRNQYVYMYWEVRGPEDTLEDYPGPTRDTVEYINDELLKYAEKLQKKTPWASIMVDSVALRSDGYTIVAKVRFSTNQQYVVIFSDILNKPAWSRNLPDKGFSKQLEIVFKFNPKVKYEDNLKVTVDKAKVQLREWAYQIRKMVENEDAKHKMTYNPNFRGSRDVLLKLPEWARPLVTFAVDNGEYYSKQFDTDRYRVEMDALPNDPRANSNPEVNFRATTIPELRSCLEDYRTKFCRIDYDY